MYLHVILLLDICNGTGTGIKRLYWTGSKVADIHQFQWPTMAKPTTGEWEFWQCGLQLGLDLGSQQQLQLPLGQTEHWWFTDLTGNQLYWLTESGWEGFTPIPSRHWIQHFQATPEALKADQLPPEVEKVTVYVHSNVIMVMGHAAIDT